jgi:hypothetical protein
LVFGHVVATDISEDAYVIPLVDTFDDIKRCLGAVSVKLPTDEDFKDSRTAVPSVIDEPVDEDFKDSRTAVPPIIDEPVDEALTIGNLEGISETLKRINISHQPLRCSWPSVFTKRRNFCRETENQSYIESVRALEHCSEDDNDDIDYLAQDEVEVYEGDEKWNGVKDAEGFNWCSYLRLFMTGMTEDEDALHYRDQIEELARFCEPANLRELETKTGQDRKHVALLDDRNIPDTMFVNKGLSPPGNRRPYLGPLTAKRLHEELSRKVAQVLCFNQSYRS